MFFLADSSSISSVCFSYLDFIECQIHSYIIEQLCMPEPLLQSLLTWSDVQSLLHRSGEADVSFKAPIAKQMHAVVNALYR